jgi:hypothetical protein
MEEVPHAGGVSYISVELKDKVRRFLSVEDKSGNAQEEQYSEPIPEELMSALEQYGGDGKARVSIGGELSTSTNFGFKASASVHMSVTCDNNLQVMEEVHDLVQPYVEALVVRDHARMADLRANMVEALTSETAARLTSPAPEEVGPGKEAAPPRAAPKATPAKAKVASGRTSKPNKTAVKSKGAKRPSFKRG